MDITRNLKGLQWRNVEDLPLEGLRITIITAVFNRRETLEQAIVSVANQTYPNIEYIIIDGESDDGTQDLVRKYRDVVTAFVSEPDEGIYDAFNKGVCLATGDYILFIGSDDCLVGNDVIAMAVDELKKNLADILEGALYQVYENEPYLGKIYQSLIRYEQVLNAKRYDGSMLGHPSMFVRRELLIKYPFDQSYQIAADYDFLLHYYYKEKVRFTCMSTAVAYFAVSGISATSADLLRQENLRIYYKYGLENKIKELKRESCWRNLIKNKIKKFIFHKSSSFFKLAQIMKRRVLQGWELHHCNNPICRWCRRK